MKQIRFYLDGTVRSADAALVGAGEDPREALVEAVIDSISTDIQVRVGDVRLHLAALMDPDHWEDELRELGVEDLDGLLAENLAERS